MEARKPPEPSLEDLYENASASVAAETLLQAMGPQLDRALNYRLSALFQAKPELGELLDCRAQLKAVWDMKQGLTNQMKKGSGAVKIMNELLLKSA